MHTTPNARTYSILAELYLLRHKFPIFHKFVFPNFSITSTNFETSQGIIKSYVLVDYQLE